MGRIFLLLIVAAGCYGAYGIYSNVSKLTGPGTPPASLPVAAAARKPEGQDTGETIKAAPAPTSSEKKEPLPVLSSNHAWIQIEAWGIIGPGDELPDGAVLESWESNHATVVTSNGTRERRRFRNVAEVLSKLAPAVAPVVASGAFEAWKKEY